MPKEAWRTHSQGGQKPVNEQKHTKTYKTLKKIIPISIDSI